MKAGLLAFGALISAAPLHAQAQDPLAPLPSPPAGGSQLIVSQPPLPEEDSPAAQTFTVPQPPAPQSPVPSAATQPTVALPPPPPTAPVIAIPKDWRAVFDAIDAGNWASARAGIAALPQSVLTSVARAELYTAKGSPSVDLTSLMALIAEAPELPQADQLARMAISRGAATSPLIVPEKATYSIGIGARPLPGQANSGRARGRFAAGFTRPVGQGG